MLQSSSSYSLLPDWKQQYITDRTPFCAIFKIYCPSISNFPSLLALKKLNWAPDKWHIKLCLGQGPADILQEEGTSLPGPNVLHLAGCFSMGWPHQRLL